MSILMKLKGKQSRSMRCWKKKKEPIKVVYISNPIKFTTSASEFRALVQQLTGQDAAADDLLPALHPTRFPESTTSTHDDDNNNEFFMFNPAPNSSSTATTQKNIISSREQPERSNSINAHYHDDDDDDYEDHEKQQQQQLYDVAGLFVPEMIDNFGLPPVLNYQ